LFKIDFRLSISDNNENNFAVRSLDKSRVYFFLFFIFTPMVKVLSNLGIEVPTRVVLKNNSVAQSSIPFTPTEPGPSQIWGVEQLRGNA
jgi:hypothetical protein